MKTLQEVVNELTVALADAQALLAVPTSAADPVVSVVVTTQSGASQEFVPKV